MMGRNKMVDILFSTVWFSTRKDAFIADSYKKGTKELPDSDFPLFPNSQLSGGKHFHKLVAKSNENKPIPHNPSSGKNGSCIKMKFGCI